jgi:hypothetical protein
MIQTNAIQVGLQGVMIFPITPGTASSAFSAAIADLSVTGGGELIIYPGYDATLSLPLKYLFDTTVVVNVPNVSLRFAPGAVLDFANSTINELFHVRAPGFRCIGAAVDHRTVVKDGRSCFRVGDPTFGLTADRAAFVDCRFRILQNVSALKGFSCIRAEGGESTLREGLDVAGCTFEWLAGVRQTVAWDGDEPYGVCAIRCRNSRGGLFTENLVFGPSEAIKGTCGPVLFLDNAPHTRITANILRGLDLIPAADGQGNSPPGGSLIRITTHGAHLGHRTLFAENVVRGVDARFVLELLGVRNDEVLCNVMQGIGPHCDAVLKTGQVTGVSSIGMALLIAGNVMSEIEGGGQPATQGIPIWLEHVSSVTCAGGAFTDVVRSVGPVVTGPGPCSDVHVSPVQAS